MNPKINLVAIALSGLLAAQTTRSTRDGVYTEDQAKRGRAAYSDHCLECHGRDLEGDVENRPLIGGEFLTNWEGSTVAGLFDRIHTTMPGDKPGTLNRETVVDIVSFLLQMNKFPAGNTELSPKGELLQQIRFDLPNP